MMEHGLRTIVGGRSVAYREAGGFPRGMEILLKKAKVDPAFRELLLKDPAAAAAAIDLTVSTSELKILSTTPPSLLSSMIDRTFVPRQHVATFLKASSAAMLALVLGTSVIIPSFAGGAGERIDLEYYTDLARTRMASLQTALEQYRLERGNYPSTEEWLGPHHPLDGYATPADLQDPWVRSYHYEGVENEAGEVVNYLLESLGPNADESDDNISCPTDPQLHSFPRDSAR